MSPRSRTSTSTPASASAAPGGAAAAASILAVLLAAGLVAAPPSSDGDETAAGPPDSAVLAGRELEDLGLTLKAAVASGAMTETDAVRVWKMMAERIEARAGRGRRADGKGGKAADAGPDRGALLAARPGPVRELLQPSFLRRDRSRLLAPLELDPDQRAIVDLLLEDHARAIALASEPLEVALARFREAQQTVEIAEALARSAVVSIDDAIDRTQDLVHRWREEAAAKEARAEQAPREEKGEASRGGAARSATTGAAASGAGKDEGDRRRAADDVEDRDDFASRLVRAAADLDLRLAGLEAQAQRRLDLLEESGGIVTAADALVIARTLREERDALERDLVDRLSLVLVVPRRGEVRERDRRAFARALAEATLARRLAEGRFGGEGTDPWAAFAALERDAGRLAEPVRDELLARLDDLALEIAGLLDARTAAILDREIAGLRWLAAHERIHGRRDADGTADRTALAPATTGFAAAARVEIAAAVAVRDRLLEEAAALGFALEAAGVEAAGVRAFRRAAERGGFPGDGDDLRAERAIVEARRHVERAGTMPDVEVLDALDALAAEVAVEADALRSEAFARRIDGEPRRALERIDRLEDRLAGRADDGFPLEDWTALDRDAVTALDRRIVGAIEALLGPEAIGAFGSDGGKSDPKAVGGAVKSGAGKD